MGQHAFTPLINPKTAAESTVISTNRGASPGCLSAIGTLGSGETIDVQIPANTDPDPAEDNDWIDFYQDDVQIQITSTNHAIAIPVGLTVRVVKNATALDVGVRWS